MNNKSNNLYALLLIGAAVIVIVIMHVIAGTHFNIPLISLLPFNSAIQPVDLQNGVPTQQKGKPPTSVQRFTLTSGVVSYNVRGKFVTNPAYNAQNVLQSDFVIDEDPASHRIPVVMTIKTGKINVGRSQGSLNGTTVWRLEDTESLRQSIKVNAPAQLRLVPVSLALTAYDLSVQKTMNSIMASNWSIPDDFVLHPPMVGVVQ